MKTRIIYFISLFVCLIAVSVALQCCSQKQDSRPVISDAERARASWECQNVLSRHNYYHATAMHLQELDDIWVKEDGEYAATAKFSQPQQVMMGLDTIKADYGKTGDQSARKGIWGMHLNTTPIIVIADDGKTAKGVWYSPGVEVGFRGEKDKDGNPVASGNWWWEKYGVDFVKEDGEWKIWHIQMYYDHTPQISSETGSTIWTKPSGGGGGGGQALQPGHEANPNPYKAWGPDTVPVLRPELPEPYYTFSETFSY